MGLGRANGETIPGPVGAPHNLFLIFWACGMLPDIAFTWRSCDERRRSLKDRVAFTLTFTNRHKPSGHSLDTHSLERWTSLTSTPHSPQHLNTSTPHNRRTPNFSIWLSGWRTSTGRSLVLLWASTFALKVRVTYVQSAVDLEPSAYDVYRPKSARAASS